MTEISPIIYGHSLKLLFPTVMSLPACKKWGSIPTATAAALAAAAVFQARVGGGRVSRNDEPSEKNKRANCAVTGEDSQPRERERERNRERETI